MTTFPASAVALATGASLPTIQRYLRGTVRLQSCDVPSTGSGAKRGYSRRRVNEIALITEQTRLGITPSRAAKAAFEFSDRGGTGRAVGELFPLGRTLLVGLPGGEHRVINLPPDLSTSDVLGHQSAAFIIDCNQVVAKVTQKLKEIN